MTEIESIMAKGVITKDFLHPETICEFFVDENRKKIWAICLDLLIEFDRVCRKNDLRYTLIFGSLLGAIRHKGFIPWDDDIDVAMPRSDYEKLRYLSCEFSSPYFLQFPCDDPGYYVSFAKLRNSNTTGISIPLRYESFNQGMFLDIFPIDDFIDGNIEKETKDIRLLMSECSCIMRKNNRFLDEKDKERFKQFSVLRRGDEVVIEMESIFRKYEKQPSEKCILWSFQGYSYEKIIFNKHYFDELCEIDFYGHRVFIPKKYRDVLSITYGNYLTFPPIEMRGVGHSNNMVFNTDIPYRDYLTRLREEDVNRTNRAKV